MMKKDNIVEQVYIIGTGGFAAEITEYIYQNNKKQFNPMSIIGYFDNNEKNYKKYAFEAPFLGSEKGFKFDQNDNIIIAIGNQKIREKVIESMKYKELNLINLIHYSAIIPRNIVFGKGNIICPNVVIGPKVSIGQYNIINFNSAISHDCVIGDENILSPNVQIAGNCTIEKSNYFGISSGCVPNVKIGNHNKINANAIIDKNIESDYFIFNANKLRQIKEIS